MDKNVSQWDERQLKKILEDLEVDVPVMSTRIVGDRLEISLYGGKVLVWAEEKSEPEAEPKKPAAKKPASKK